MTVEKEVGEFLYGLIRVLKPAKVLETGCYIGESSAAIWRAVVDNHVACQFFTCDTKLSHVEDTKQRLVPDRTGRCQCFVLDQDGVSLAKRIEDVDFAFLDSSGDRVEEAMNLKLADNAYIVIHDSRRDYIPRILNIMKWKHIFFPTPRGLSVLWKQGKENKL